MQTIEKLHSLQHILASSPLINTSKEFPNSIGLVSQLNSYRKEIDILIGKCYNPLKIVLMGEVKAGKSTLINALAGGQISPTNVSESTASIIEIKHASHSKSKLIKKSGESVEGQSEEIYQLLDDHRGDQEFFSSIDYVQVEHYLPNLRKVQLVDTPGLATVTVENESRTVEYIQNSDVVLWVFSAHHLGQSDIEEQLNNVKSFGKPIIGVVNRLDEVDSTAEELEEFINDRLGFFIDETFAISAYQAFLGTGEKNEQLMQTSRFPQLLAYLEENIEKQTLNVQEESLISSAEALAEKEQIQHQLVVENADFLLHSMNRRKIEIQYHNKEIKQKIKLDIENWIENELFEDEKRSLLLEIDSLGKMAGKESYDSIASRFKKIVSSEEILKNLDKKYNDISAVYKGEWNNAIESIGEKINLEEEEFRERQSIVYNDIQLSYTTLLPEGENIIADGAKKGAAIGGAYGFAAATYAAVLGPSAAGITLGTALGAFMPPVLIIGAVTGIAAKLVFGNKKKKEFSIEVTRTFEEAKSKVRHVFMPALIDHLEKQNTQTANELYNKICEFMSQGWTDQELNNLKQEILIYKDRIARWKHDIPNTSIVN